MGLSDLKKELQAIDPAAMIEASKAVSWKVGRSAEGYREEYLAFKEEYPGLAICVQLMIEAAIAHGASEEDAIRNNVSGGLAFLALKQLIDANELQNIVEG